MVTLESVGFRKEVFERQTLQINQTLRLDAKLAIGQTSETVEVTDQVANIETVNQTVGATVTGPAIQQAPLNSRNVLDLAKLQPGVMKTNGRSEQGHDGRDEGADERMFPVRSAADKRLKFKNFP